MVFQNYALYPHMTVAENMGFALKIAERRQGRRSRKRVEEAAKLLDLTEYLGRKPKALSGGQRQRVAMGRAIVREPQVFLMDEPLSNLDAKLRVQTRTQIASLQRRLGITTVYVTHDQVEAMTMGDRVAVLKDGLLQQVRHPARHVREAGERVRRGLHRLPGDEPDRGADRRGRREVRRPGRPGLPRRARRGLRRRREALTVGVRPESFDFVGDAEGAIAMEVQPGRGARRGRVRLHARAHVGDRDVDMIVRVDARAVPMKGDTLYVKPRATRPTCSRRAPASASTRKQGAKYDSGLVPGADYARIPCLGTKARCPRITVMGRRAVKGLNRPQKTLQEWTGMSADTVVADKPEAVPRRRPPGLERFQGLGTRLLTYRLFGVSSGVLLLILPVFVLQLSLQIVSRGMWNHPPDSRYYMPMMARDMGH